MRGFGQSKVASSHQRDMAGGGEQAGLGYNGSIGTHGFDQNVAAAMGDHGGLIEAFRSIRQDRAVAEGDVSVDGAQTD